MIRLGATARPSIAIPAPMSREPGPLVKEETKIKLGKTMAAGKEAARKLKHEPDDSGGAPKPAPEDTFGLPPVEPNHDGPPKDPNAPSGSLSSDGAEALTVDFTPNPK
jgi:hypothetical protein